MKKEQKELIEKFERLEPINRADTLAHIRLVYIIQENTKRQYGIEEANVKPPETGARVTA